MFMLRNGKLIFGSGNQEALIELSQGQLYLVRPQSPKGYSELIFKDSAARIRKISAEFQYQLVVQRVYEEGEEELLAEEGDNGQSAEVSERDEKVFLLDRDLHFRVETRQGSETILAWRDLSGDTGDVYEFICDASIPHDQIAQFQQVARNCQYERLYKKPHTTASQADFEQFDFDEDQPIPPASPIHSPTLAHPIESTDAIFAKVIAQNQNTQLLPTAVTVTPTPVADMRPLSTSYSEDEDDIEAQLQAEAQLQQDLEDELEAEEAELRRQLEEAEAEAESHVQAEAEKADAAVIAAPPALDTYVSVIAELHFFDFVSGTFVLKDDEVIAVVTEVGSWQYWLETKGKNNWVSVSVTPDVNPVFNFEYLSFIFNQVSEDGSANSWLLRFKDQPTMEKFQEGLLRALWEQLNLIKWAKIKDVERDYITDAFNDLTMEDAENVEEEEEEEEEEEPEQEAHSEDEEEDSDDDTPEKKGDGNVNSQLAVGYKHDRSFVVRGSKIGVFKHTANNNLEFSTNISRVETPGGKLFSPKKVMLHNEDRDLILQHGTDTNKLYRMDLEYGKVVDEWNVHDSIPITTFAPEKKFAQMTGEQTFLGISHNALFRVDPRLAGDKLVNSQLKQYASKNDFSALASTEKGYVAVASNKGDIRLFDRLGINAKTHIPALGEPIIGLDVSADGRWLLATCRTYLLLIDTLQKEGKNEGKLGFERSFAVDKKPQPRRLALTPEHVAQFAYEIKRGVSFTPARFNTGEGTEETSIITATGPYIIEWNLKKVVKGSKTPYLIKRYVEDVMADNFKFGTDKNVIVALPNEVNMVGKKALKKPTRESISGSFQVGGRRSLKPALDDIVESTY